MTANIFECIKTRLSGPDHRSMPDQHFTPPNLGRRTTAQPGTPRKLNVLCDRLEDGEPLFNARDTNCFDEGGPC